MPLESLFRLLLPAQAEQGLAEKKIRRRIIRLELDDLRELVDGILKMPQLEMRPAELEADGVDLAVDPLGLLQRLDCLLKFPQPHIGAAIDVVRRGGVGVHAQNL